MNGCVSYGDGNRQVHFLSWDKEMWDGRERYDNRITKSNQEAREKRENWWMIAADAAVSYHDGRGYVPALCRHLYIGDWKFGPKNGYKQPLFTSEVTKVTCANCLARLCMLGIACGC